MRSFDADSTEFRQKRGSTGSSGNFVIDSVEEELSGSETGEFYSLTTWEELTASVFADIGPVVAVGIPGETVAPIGSARIYFEDSDWRANVEYLMSISRLVIIQADISEGLEWEIAAAKRSVDPKGLLLSFLSWEAFDRDTRQDLYERFKPKVESLLNITLPERIGKTIFICFEADWTPGALGVNLWKRVLYFKVPRLSWEWMLTCLAFSGLRMSLSAAAIRETIRTALKQRGMRLKPYGSLARAFVNLCSCSFLLFWVVYGKRTSYIVVMLLLILVFVVFWFVRKQAHGRLTRIFD